MGGTIGNNTRGEAGAWLQECLLQVLLALRYSGWTHPGLLATVEIFKDLPLEDVSLLLTAIWRSLRVPVALFPTFVLKPLLFAPAPFHRASSSVLISSILILSPHLPCPLHLPPLPTRTCPSSISRPARSALRTGTDWLDGPRRLRTRDTAALSNPSKARVDASEEERGGKGTPPMSAQDVEAVMAAVDPSAAKHDRPLKCARCSSEGSSWVAACPRCFAACSVLRYSSSSRGQWLCVQWEGGSPVLLDGTPSDPPRDSERVVLWSSSSVSGWRSLVRAMLHKHCSVLGARYGLLTKAVGC